MPEQQTSEFELEAWLADWLGNDAELAAIIGGRLFPVFVPPGYDLPAVSYRRTSTERDASTREALKVAKATFEIRCWAMSDLQGYLKGCRAARVVRLKLNGLQTSGMGQHIRRALLTGENDDEEQGVIADDTFAVCRVLTVEISYVEQTRNAIGGA